MIKIASLLCALVFLWAGVCYFKGNQQKYKFPLLLITLSFVGSFASVAFADFSLALHPIRGIFALLLYITAIAVFSLAVKASRKHRLTLAFSDDPPVYLIETGPYRWIRNPFYTSYLLAALANFIVIPGAITGVCFVLLAVVLDAATVSEENKFYHSGLWREYTAYEARTGRFIPRIFSSRS